MSRVMPEIKQLLGKSPPDPPPGSLMEVDPDPVALTLVVERRVQPGRRGKPTDLTDGIKKTEDAQVNIKNKSKMEVEVEVEGEEEVKEEAYPGEHCLMQCLAKVDELAAALSAAKATGPPGGWRVFRQGIKKLRVQDHDQQGMDHDQRGTEMIAACREKLGEIEALLADATGNIEVLAKAEDEMEVEEASEMKDEEEVVESDETDVPKSKWGRYVWRSRRERRSWLKMLEGAGTAPRLAYLANVLSFLSSGPVAAL